MYVVVLANNTREASSYIKAAGLSRARTRYASKASTIRGLRTAEVRILPGFKRRLDRHAILSELRWTKAKIREVSAEEIRQLLTAYPLEKAATIAARYLAIQEAARGEEAGETEPSEDAAPAEAPKRRRSRCRTCGELHFSDEPCVQSVQSVQTVNVINVEQPVKDRAAILAAEGFFG